MIRSSSSHNLKTGGIPHVREVSNPRAMLRATSRSCKAGTSPSVCCTLLLASLTVVLVTVASSSAPPVAATRIGSSLPQVFTNSFLVKLRGVQDRKQADLIARRNGFENWGSVNTITTILLFLKFQTEFVINRWIRDCEWKMLNPVELTTSILMLVAPPLAASSSTKSCISQPLFSLYSFSFYIFHFSRIVSSSYHPLLLPFSYLLFSYCFPR